MSVLPMKRVLIVGLRRDRKRMLEFLQRRGVLEIVTEDADESDPVFTRLDVSGQRTTFEKNAKLAADALAVLDAAAPPTDKGGLFAGRRVMSLTDYETNTKKREQAMNAVYEINALAKKRADIQAEIPKCEMQLEALRPWAGFSEALDFNGTRETCAYVGTLPNEHTQAEVEEALSKGAPDAVGIDAEIISASAEQTCLMIVCHKKDKKEVEETLRHIGFARPSVSGGVPDTMMQDTSARLKTLYQEADAAKEKIAAYAPKRDLIRFAVDYFTLRADKYAVLGSIDQTEKVFLLKGYATEKEAAKLASDLAARFDCVTELETPGEDEEVPVALKNNWFGSPVEGVVTSYAVPGKGEIDPSFIVAVFYYFLFGMMLSDAGYGILMVAACAVLLHLRKDTIEPGMKKALTMFMYAGVGTTFWGILFGSWFGNLPQTIVQTFINPEADFSLALWVEPTVEPTTVLGFSFVVGIIHVFAGLIALAYQNVKQGKTKDALYDAGLWLLLLTGGIGLLVSSDMIKDMFGLSFVMPAALMSIFKYMAIIGAIGVVLFCGNRDTKNWGLRIGTGIYALYGVTSYLSDVLSYSRLLALGLATGVISSVFNSMAAMVGGVPLLGPVLFALICLVGHAMNLAINALGAYVHTNRLEYVEFFGKFYNGGGKAFTPFEEHTKYYRITE